jgi:alkanesulfonate monooxygenase SsuD/methylene tetrahydromethanopterin reductase-like flavin-dependent oxidoreductase (luciferase family)
MVDVLSGGRLSLGTGSGYLSHEFAGFGVEPADKHERFDEALEIVLKAWTGERFSHQGRFYQVRDVQLNVAPLQKPHPPIWIAVLRNEAAAQVGKRGFPIMMIPYATTEHITELAETVTAFRDAFADGGGDPRNATVPFGLHTYVSDSFAQASADARPAMERYVRTRLYAVQRPFETLVEQDVVAIGDPYEVLRVARRYEAAGFTHFLAIANFGGLPHKRVLRSMELMARHVLPRL